MSNLKGLLDSIHESVELSTDKELKNAVKLIIEVQNLSVDERDNIKAAFERGPLDDGDVTSKSGRDSLVEKGFMKKVIVKGEWGFNAVTYKGAYAYKLIKAGACKN